MMPNAWIAPAGAANSDRGPSSQAAPVTAEFDGFTVIRLTGITVASAV